MSYYDDRPQDLIQDTKNFLKSDYGKHIIDTLEAKATGHLANTCNIEHPYPERYAAKYSAIKEILEFIHSPLDDDTPPRG